MLFSHKNKRQFGYRSHRNLFVALFLFLVFGISALATLLLNANAQLVPVTSVEISSEHKSYANHEEDAWKVTKSAKWTGAGKARITFKVESNKKNKYNKYDVVMVIDDSGSMGGEKMVKVKEDAVELAESLLADEDNRIALVSFDNMATKQLVFTNNLQSVLDAIDALPTEGCTNYYDAFLKAEEILEGYERVENRGLLLLFLTDGYPNVDTPNEVGEYRVIKAMYPYIEVSGIQYEMGDTILQPIIDISDNQYIAYMETLSNVLFEATYLPTVYDDFVITDFIDDAYWSVGDISKINVSLGAADLDFEGSTPKVTWDMSGLYRSGTEATMTIDIDLKPELLDQGELFPTNKHEIIRTSMHNEPDEYIDSNLTPVLKDSYQVIYDANLPRGCNVSGIIPETTTHSVLTTVSISGEQLRCEEAVFKGWRVVAEKSSDVKFINDDYFIMPERDVTIRAIWGIPGISKSLVGAPSQHGSAILDYGSAVNTKLKNLAAAQGSSVKSIVRAFQLIPTIALDGDDNIISSSTSDLPVYAWFNDGTIYYYSDADDVYMNPNSSGLFNLTDLEDIDGLRYLKASRVTSMSSMFANTNILDFSPVSEWDVSHVTNMSSMFYYALVTDLHGLENWNTSSLMYMSSMFRNAEKLTNIDALTRWDVSHVTTMTRLFYEAKAITNVNGARKWDTSNVQSMDYLLFRAFALTDIRGLRDWNTSKVYTFSNAFSETAIANIDDLSDWNTSSATNMSYMFWIAKSLENIDGAINWDVSKVTTTSQMFYGTEKLKNINGAVNWRFFKLQNSSLMFQNSTSIKNIDAAANWGMSKVTDPRFMFDGASSLENVDGAANWDTSSMTNLFFLFSNTPKLKDISGLANWNISSVTAMTYTFYNAGITNTDALLNWDTSNVTEMDGVFKSATELSDVRGLRNWNISKVTKMDQFFYECTKLKNTNGLERKNVDGIMRWDMPQLTSIYGMFSRSGVENLDGIASWNTSAIKNMEDLFYYTQVTNIDALADWDISSVTTMEGMFTGASKLVNVDGALNWNVSNVKSMDDMFSYASSLSDISGLRNWQTSSLENTGNMFEDTSIKNIDALASWNMSRVTDISYMFSSATNLENVNGAANWDTSNVTRMYSVFQNATGLEDISGLANWNTSKVTGTGYMFYNNTSLRDISPLAKKTVGDVVRWDLSSVTYAGGMFKDCTNIEDLSPLNSWNATHLANSYYMFDGIPVEIERPTWY